MTEVRRNIDGERERVQRMDDQELARHLTQAALLGLTVVDPERQAERYVGAKQAMEWVLNVGDQRYPAMGDTESREIRSDILTQELARRTVIVSGEEQS